MTLSLYAAVRLETGDSDTNGGILPGGAYFSDAELDYAAASEGITSPNAAPTNRETGLVSAKILEMASVHWASQPEEMELGPSMEKQTQSRLLAQKAAELRSKWGNNSGSSGNSRQTPGYRGVGMSYATPSAHE